MYKRQVLEYANIFAEMDDPYLRERAADILDLGQRLLNRLQEEQPVNRAYPDPVSYTHLDVYKRQVAVWPAAASAVS